MTRIAINGFGRIGRTTLRYIFEHHDGEVELVAVNDLTSIENIIYLLKYDSVYRSFIGEIEQTAEGFKYRKKGIANDKWREVKVLAQRDPSQLPWKDLKIDVVIEATGFFANKSGAQLHINAGAKKCIISAPGGNDVKTIVYNVNHETLTKEDTIISAASCTTNSIAPVIKFMDESFKILVGKMTTIHAYTGNQGLVDMPAAKDLRRGRAAAQNIVPSSTGAAKAIGLVIPSVAGKLDGAAIRIPTIVGSLSDLTFVLGKKVTVEEVNAAAKAFSDKIKPTFGYNTDEIVSSDIIGSTHGSIFDATLTKVVEAKEDGKQLVTVGAWYDNEMSFVSQLVRLILHVAKI
ncbi:glyceraldehyde 3-phosphate dehydrogenase [Mycoplasma testudineum]|uniref:Glyceraldehyde-3-phosphate dehydrogenase n=1 Tax=Mycoplasma testudineum TaxID=244584 RepID=A0A4R6IF87_9MOLU|nr:type I glyceraldehyde-3-phosphate dehydrogenase [Mycoplasma testudineum]OYD26814.1 type I glyceraldehyde-3-phosphate dehydrogenase [Mycoplasma testudineum]TDO20348.1 glyceraldehyde 3-phosphate dehydrogenase [Mycoplasma testudineum]